MYTGYRKQLASSPSFLFPTPNDAVGGTVDESTQGHRQSISS